MSTQINTMDVRHRRDMAARAACPLGELDFECLDPESAALVVDEPVFGRLLDDIDEMANELDQLRAAARKGGWQP